MRQATLPKSSHPSKLSTPGHGSLPAGLIELDTPSADRNEQGRFSPGCKPGPGRPRGRGNVLRQAVQESVTPEHLATLMRKVLRQALEGNLTATKIVFDQTCGKPVSAQEEGQPLDIYLPQLKTASACTAAIDKLLAAICEGTVDRDAAKLLVDVIMARLKAIEVNDLEQRLTELEKTASVVDKNGGHHGRRF
ncbi:MAG: DUF5681 domain-containing protein [Planctomycetota bacterium]